MATRSPSRRKRRQPIEPPSWLAISIDAMVRHKWKAILGGIVALGGPAGIAGYFEFVEPIFPAFHYWTRDELAPIIKAQGVQDHVLDYLVQQQTIRALGAAKADMAAAPNPTTQATIDHLTKSIARLQDKMDRAATGQDE